MQTSTITAIQCIPMRLPFHHWRHPPLFAGKPRDKLDSALLRVETSDGLVGWGEAYCIETRAIRAVVQSLIEPLALGKPADDAGLVPGIERTLQNLGRSGPVLHGLAGLDIALWDLRGKREGVPVHALLGGKRRDRVRTYASLLQYYGDLEQIRVNVERALHTGYTDIKLHERTADAVAAARESAGPQCPIMVDTNCAWLPEQAQHAIEVMLPYRPYWVEEPLWPPEDLRALAALQAKVPVPLAMGENASSAYELAEVVRGNAARFIQPSVIKLGLTAAKGLSDLCEGSRVTCAPQVAFFGPGYLAALHLIASQGTDVSLERLFVELAHVPYGDSVPIRNGWITVPDGPGLGAEPELALINGQYSN